MELERENEPLQRYLEWLKVYSEVGLPRAG